MTTEIVRKTLENSPAAEVRVSAWQSFLLDMFKCETENLNSVISFLGDKSDIKEMLPSVSAESIKKIQDLEDLLKSVRAASKKSEDSRKRFTSKLDEICSRMMIPEKTFSGFDLEIKNALIKIKEIEKKENDKKIARQKELSDFEKRREIAFNDELSALNTHVHLVISEAYSDAIDNLEPSEIPSLINKIKGRLSYGIPNSVWEDSEKQAIQDKITNRHNEDSFRLSVHEKIEAKFGNFEFDKQQKEIAKKRSEDEKIERVRQISEENQINNAFAEIKSSESTSVFSLGKKQLVKVFTIECEHTEENMVIISRAFFMNIKSCIKLYRGSDPFEISVNKMSALLCELKNQDDSFSIQGITFVEQSKLSR